MKDRLGVPGGSNSQRHWRARYKTACAYRGEMLLYERALAVECVRVWREMLLMNGTVKQST